MSNAHPPELKAKALELLWNRKGVKTVARELCIGRATVKRWQKEAGIPPCPEGRQPRTPPPPPLRKQTVYQKVPPTYCSACAAFIVEVPCRACEVRAGKAAKMMDARG